MQVKFLGSQLGYINHYVMKMPIITYVAFRDKIKAAIGDKSTKTLADEFTLELTSNEISKIWNLLAVQNEDEAAHMNKEISTSLSGQIYAIVSAQPNMGESQEQATDEQGNLMWQEDPVTNEPVLDENDDPIPIMRTVRTNERKLLDSLQQMKEATTEKVNKNIEDGWNRI